MVDESPGVNPQDVINAKRWISHFTLLYVAFMVLLMLAVVVTEVVGLA